jgi:hypothetical protein
MAPFGRITLALSLASLLPQPSTAQRAALGLAAGPSTSGVVYGDRGSAHGPRPSLSGGATVRSRLGHRVSFAGNLLLSAKGFTQSEPLIQYSYLELPLLVHLEFGSQEARIQPYVGLGIALAVMLKCRRSFVGVNGPHEDHCEQTQASNLNLVAIKGIDVGQDYRLGLRIVAFWGAFVIEGRHARGMVDIEPGHDTRNRFSALTVGYELWR